MDPLFELQAQVDDLATLLQGTREELRHERQRRVEREARAARGRRIGKASVAVVLAAVMLGGGAREVLAWGGCAQTLPGPLKTFCSGDPAVAKDINGNFQTLVTWMQQKVGPVGSQDVTVKGAASVTGKMSANGGLAVTGAQTVSSELKVKGLVSADGGLVVGGSQKVSKDLTVSGKVLADGELEAKGDVLMNKSLIVYGQVTANGDIASKKTIQAAKIKGDVVNIPSVPVSTTQLGGTKHILYELKAGSCSGKGNGAIGYNTVNAIGNICVCYKNFWHCIVSKT